jgi:hypothetical protein
MRNKANAVTTWVRETVPRMVPRPVAMAYRRRRAARRYVQDLSQEVLDRQARLDHLEERVADRREGLYERIVSDVVSRTELILQELDRRIGTVAARTDRELAAVEEQLAEMAKQVARIREIQESSVGNGQSASAKSAAKRGGSRRKPPAAVAE